MKKKKKSKKTNKKKAVDSQEFSKLKDKLEQSENELNALREELAEKEESLEGYLDQTRRIKAEFMNYKKRVAKTASRDKERGARELAADLLVILDNLERALASEEVDLEGIDLINREFYNILKKWGLKKMEVSGKIFDHNYHHAISYINDEESKDNTVVEVIEPGYFWKEEVLRPAKVVVNKKKETGG